MTKVLPKKIWFLWFQGLDDAPYVVKKCYESWVNRNGDWEVILLDENNLSEYIDLKLAIGKNRELIPRQALSDVIRINLLNKYGGVWVDSTCYCVEPLKKWLLPNFKSGFFAFSNPGKGRLLSSWFLAASEDSELVNQYAIGVNNFWRKNNKLLLVNQRKGIHYLIKKIRLHRFLKNNTGLWFSPLFTKVLKVYPYFWFHYYFEKLYNEQANVKKVWDKSSKIPAKEPHLLFEYGLLNPLNELVKNHIDQKKTPIYKLSWKYDTSKISDESVLNYLLSKK